MEAELINSYRQEYAYIAEMEDGTEVDAYYDECVDQDNWDLCIQDVNNMLLSKEYIRVEGVSGYWNGSTDVDILIPAQTFNEVSEKYLHMEDVELLAYTNKVEYINRGHDATSRYTFTPIDLVDLTKSELLDLIDEDDFKYYTDKSCKYVTKLTLIDYIGNNGLKDN